MMLRDTAEPVVTRLSARGREGSTELSAAVTLRLACSAGVLTGEEPNGGKVALVSRPELSH